MTSEKISPVTEKYGRGKHPNSKKNLIMFPPGHNGNPNPGLSLTCRLRKALLESKKEPGKDASVAEQLVYSTLEGALKREPTPFREVWDRVDGKLQDTPPVFTDVKVMIVREEPKQLVEGDSEVIDA
jgi:hypothetical protein